MAGQTGAEPEVLRGMLRRDHGDTFQSTYTRRLAEGTGVRSYYMASPGCTKVGVVSSVWDCPPDK